MTLTIITYYYVLHFYPFIILHSITPAFIIFITKSLLRSFTSLLHHHNCNHDITSLFHDCYIIITFTIITLLLHYYYVLLKIHYYILFHYYYTYFIIITKGNSCINDSIITCYAKGSLHYYIFITYY